MARKIAQYNGQIIPVDSDYPDGDIKDDTGLGDGTDIDRKSNADMQQFFMKLMRKASITANGLPDNEYNGFQFIKALDTRNYKVYSAQISQGGTSAPTGNVLGDNYIGNIVWTRTGTGIYVGTLTGAFPAQLTFCQVSGIISGGSAIMVRTGNNTVQLNTYSGASTLADSILNGFIEIRVYSVAVGF